MLTKEQEIAQLKAQLAMLTNKKVVLEAPAPGESIVDDDNPFAMDDESGDEAPTEPTMDDFDALFA